MIALADFINGVFEFGLSLFLIKGTALLCRDKKVTGFYWPTVAWTTSWGLWNLYFYPSLGQWWSFTGGLSVVSVNVTWLALVFYFKQQERVAHDVDSNAKRQSIQSS